MGLPLSVLRHRDFRLLFLGQSASTIGDRAVVVAIGLFVTRRTGSATDLGIVLLAQALPLILLLLIGGVWADRGGGRGRLRIMIACDLARAALHGLLAALIFTGAVRIWQMVAIEAAFGAAQAFFQPAYTGLLPLTVPAGEVQGARALTEASANLSIVLGPALATALVLGAGAGWAFAVDAASFLVSVACLLPVGTRRVAGAVHVATTTVLDGLRGGFAEVRSRPWVSVTIAVYAWIIFFAYGPWFVLAPLVARDRYGDLGLFGVLSTLIGAGALAGALVGLRWRPRHPVRTGLILGVLWPGPNIALALLAPRGVLLPVAAASGFGFSLEMIWWETSLAEHIPPHALSRVSSYDWMGSLVLLPAAYAVAGPAAATLGPRAVLGVGGSIGIVLTALALLPRSTRALTAGPPAAASAAESGAEDVAREVGVELRGEA